jgi:phenylpropionate dioxygenase-like ring-hydroxylating dioxygenase large terminal subunit
VDGRILETPGEPVSSTLRDRLCQGAYPTHEFGGLVFAYLGPPDRMPAFPRYDTFDLPGYTLMPAGKFALPCNWLQIKDNSMDPVHTSFLHAISSGYQFTEAFGALAELDWEETPYGMMSSPRAASASWCGCAWPTSWLPTSISSPASSRTPRRKKRRAGPW